MANERESLPMDAGMNLGGINALLQTLFGTGDTKQTTSSTQTQGGGDLGALRAVFAAMQPGLTAEGSNALIQTIFRQGFEQNLPQIFAGNNAAGIRGNVTSELLKNDLTSRLSGEALTRLSENQARAGAVGDAIARNSPRTNTSTQTTKGKNPGLLGDGGNLMQLGLAALLNGIFSGRNNKKGNEFQLLPNENAAFESTNFGTTSNVGDNFAFDPTLAFTSTGNPAVSSLLNTVFPNSAANVLDFRSAPAITAPATIDYAGSVRNYFLSGDLTEKDALRSYEDFIIQRGGAEGAYNYLSANSPAFQSFTTTGTNPGAVADQSGGTSLLDSLFQAVSGAQNFGPGGGPATSGGDRLSVSSQ